MIRGSFIALAALALGGCTTSSSTAPSIMPSVAANMVQFTSEPSGAEVHTSSGLHCKATPCTLTLEKKLDFVATFTKPGLELVSVTVKVTSVDAGLTAAPNPVHAQMAEAKPRLRTGPRTGNSRLSVEPSAAAQD